MQTRALDLRFKGDRRYLHGTDVYDAAMAALGACFPGAAGRVRYSFHAIAPTKGLCRAPRPPAPDEWTFARITAGEW